MLSKTGLSAILKYSLGISCRELNEGILFRILFSFIANAPVFRNLLKPEISVRLFVVIIQNNEATVSRFGHP